MFRVIGIAIWVSLLFIACGGSDEKKSGKDIQLDKKVELPTVDGTPFLVTALPKDARRIDANLDNKAMLLGYTISTDTASPGQALVVTWYWKSLKPIESNWEYFTHLMDEDGEMIRSSNSSGAMRSQYKPQMWKPGEIIQDVEQITVPNDWKSPVLELRTGFWQGPDRMTVRKGPVDAVNRIKGPVVTVAANAPTPIPRSTAAVNVPLTKKAPKIDGKLDDKPWESAVSLGNFVNTLNGRPVATKTETKLLWDKDHLYISVSCDDTDLISPMESSNDSLWMADAFDLFLQAGEAGKYFEIQITPKQIVFDAAYETYRKADMTWESNINLAVEVNGTLNDPSSPDTGWNLEAAIPLAGILPEFTAGVSLRANFFRINKSAAATEYSGWSAPMRGDFHAQDRFGKLVLAE